MKMLKSLSIDLKGRLEKEQDKIDGNARRERLHDHQKNGEKTPGAHKRFVIFAQLGKKNKCADIFKNTVID